MAQAFNPAEWLAGFERVGGAYAFNGERLHLWIVPGELTDEELSDARVLVVAMTPDNRCSLAEHLRAAEMVEG